MQSINQLNHKRTRAAFRSVGFNEKDYVSSEVLRDAIDTLNNQQFDHDIFEQLWQQCKLNSQGQTKIDNFIDTIIRAQAILIQKQKEMIVAQSALERKKAHNSTPVEERQKIQEELEQLIDLKSGFALDLQLLRKPFRNFAMETIYPAGGELQNMDGSFFGNEPRSSRMSETALIPISNKKNMTWIAYLSLLLSALQMLIALNLTTFMNTVLFLLIFSMYLFEHFDRSTIRLLFWSTIFTQIVDVLWYCLIVSTLWSPPQVGIWPQFMAGYLKFSVVLTSFIFIGKLLLLMLLCSEYNIDESKTQQVRIFNVTFILSSKNENAPLKKLIDEYLPKSKGLNEGHARSSSPSRNK